MKITLRTLGQSDLKITPIGIGAWAIGGGKWEFAWGAQDDTESIKLSADDVLEIEQGLTRQAA